MENLNLNLLLIIAGIVCVIKMADGYRKGMVREIISLVSLAVLSGVVALIAYGVSSYYDGKFYNTAVIVVLLGLLGVAHHLLRVVFFSAKMVTKLPVVHFGDKLLGVVFGIFEVVVALWILYTCIMMMDTGAIGQLILSYTEESPILLWVYQHNYLARWIERILDQFSFVPLDVINELSEIWG